LTIYNLSAEFDSAFMSGSVSYLIDRAMLDFNCTTGDVNYEILM
jgi:hypothetical protein